VRPLRFAVHRRTGIDRKIAAEIHARDVSRVGLPTVRAPLETFRKDALHIRAFKSNMKCEIGRLSYASLRDSPASVRPPDFLAPSAALSTGIHGGAAGNKPSGTHGTRR
jgi:hypothetical protein